MKYLCPKCLNLWENHEFSTPEPYCTKMSSIIPAKETKAILEEGATEELVTSLEKITQELNRQVKYFGKRSHFWPLDKLIKYSNEKNLIEALKEL